METKESPSGMGANSLLGTVSKCVLGNPVVPWKIVAVPNEKISNGKQVGGGEWSTLTTSEPSLQCTATQGALRSCRATARCNRHGQYILQCAHMSHLSESSTMSRDSTTDQSTWEGVSESTKVKPRRYSSHKSITWLKSGLGHFNSQPKGQARW